MIILPARGHKHGWQLILADLALILFLVTLSALASERSPTDDRTPPAQIAAAQTLFRPAPLVSPSGPTLTEWLAERPYDPRATLTVFAQHTGDDRAEIWKRAQMLADDAESADFAVRVVITQGDISDLYASLAYDAPNPAGAGVR